MEKIRRNTKNEESRQFWAAIQQTAEEVASWPAWKRGGSSLPLSKRKNDKKSAGTKKPKAPRTLSPA